MTKTGHITKFGRALWKIVSAVLLLALFLVVATSVSPVYNFSEPKPFSGKDIFNPYAAVEGLDTIEWKRANFHTHTRVTGPLPPNECKYWPGEVDSIYRKLGYDIVTFSNHNELTTHPYDSTLQVNVYEHGYNVFQYHKLVFGCHSVNYFDHLVPLFAFQKQFQLDLLGKDADFIQMNHPFRTVGTSQEHFRKLEGYQIMELDSHRTTENEYWDWALSAGIYSFGLANDDLHYPDISECIAKRCNFLYCPSGRYDDLKNTLLSGAYYSMRVPDYGHGDWDVKYERNHHLPYVRSIGLDSATVCIALSQKADSIKFFGQDHRLLAMARNDSTACYEMQPSDTYARITAYMPEGEVIYSNPFARYDAATSQSPFHAPTHTVNIPLTIIYNLLILVLCAGIIVLFYKKIIK